MARKFWERLSSTRILFYQEPLDLDRDEMDARIAELQAILALPDNIKAILAEANPTIGSTSDFDDVFEDELFQLADQRDYYDNANVTVTEEIEVVDHRWMHPAEMSLGPGTLVDFCGEEVGNEAIGAIDGIGSNSWQHDVDEVHEITIDLGYKKRIDGIRVKSSASPGGPLQLSGVDVRIASKLANLDDAASLVGEDLSFTDPLENDRDLTARTGRYIRVTIGSTGHNSNHITLRDVCFRTRPRTFGL